VHEAPVAVSDTGTMEHTTDMQDIEDMEVVQDAKQEPVGTDPLPSSPTSGPAYYKNVLQDAGKNNDNLAAANECACLEPNYNIASNSRGCLKCTTEDCSYYIQNIVETFLLDYNISIYACTK